jgi:hypothetical protein
MKNICVVVCTAASFAACFIGLFDGNVVAAADADAICGAVSAALNVKPGQRLVLFNRGVTISDYSSLDGSSISRDLDKLSDAYKEANLRLSWADVANNIIWAVPSLPDSRASELTDAVLFLYQTPSREVRSAAYLNYLEYKSRYTKLLSDLQTPPVHVLLPSEQAQVQQAKDDFELLGQKTLVEKYIKIVEKYDALAALPEKATFERSVWAASHPDQVSYTYTPSLDGLFASDTGWKQLSITVPAKEVVPSFSPTNSQCGDPLFSFPIVGDGVLSPASVVTTDSAMRLDLVIQLVNVTRPWPPIDLFASHRWKLKSGQPLSNGDLSSPKGLLPRIPVQFILAAHGTYISDTPGPMRKAVAVAIRKKSVASLVPPFVAAGPQDIGDSAGDYLRPNGIAAGISADFPQVIGVVIQALPQSPNPDGGLSWNE